MSRAESAKRLKELLNDELCTLVACRQAMERIKEPATVAELRRIAVNHEDSISHLRAAVIDRAEEPNDDPSVCEPWAKALHELGDANQSDAILASLRNAESICKNRVARAAATREGLDETARRMVSEVILPRHLETLEALDKFQVQRLAEPEAVAERAAAEAGQAIPHAMRREEGAEPEGQTADGEPHLLRTAQGFALQVAKAGLMVGAYGLAVATMPLRFALRKGLGLVSPSPSPV